MHLLMSFMKAMLPSNYSSTEDIHAFVSALQTELNDGDAKNLVMVAIYASRGLKYEPPDPRQVMFSLDTLEPATSKEKADSEEGNGFLAAADMFGVWNEGPLSSCRIKSTDLSDLKPSSGGGYGEMWVGTFRKRRQVKPVAIKRLAIGDQSKASALAFAAEIKFMKELEHPNLVAFVGVEWTKEWQAQVVTEYMPHGDLSAVLDVERQKEDSAWRTWTDFKCQLAIDVVDGLVCLHSRSPQVCMQTLKARNVLLGAQIDSEEGYVGRAKLSLYAVGRSRRAEQIHESSLRWLAPELATSAAACTSPATIYSFGVFLSELDTCRLPYYDALNPDGSPMSSFKVLQLVCKGLLRPTMSEDCPAAMAAVMAQCLAQDPTQRLSAAQLAFTLRDIRKNEL